MSPEPFTNITSNYITLTIVIPQDLTVFYIKNDICSVLAITLLRNFSKECLDKTHVTLDYPMMASVVCVAVTQPSLRKLPEAFRIC
jgi:hypothetical protein